MEEQKKAAKTVNLGSDTNNENKPQKYSYEELNKICIQLEQQNQYLMKQLYQANQTNMFKRLDYLFKVLEFESTIKDANFVNNCIAEIKEAIIIPEEVIEKEETAESKEA